MIPLGLKKPFFQSVPPPQADIQTFRDEVKDYKLSPRSKRKSFRLLAAEKFTFVIFVSADLEIFQDLQILFFGAY